MSCAIVYVTRCQAQIPLVASRHDTTRHAIWPMHFGTGKSRDVLCRACRTAWRDRLITTSATGATRTTRVQRRRRSVDWDGQKLFLRLMQIQSTVD